MIILESGINKDWPKKREEREKFSHNSRRGKNATYVEKVAPYCSLYERHEGKRK